VQGYKVEVDGRWVEGRERPGKVVLTPTDDTLNIYLERDYLPKSNPYELTEQLELLTGIHERQSGDFLLHIVLTEQDLNTIAEIFDHNGVPSKFDDDEDVENSWLHAQEPRGTAPGVPKYEAEPFRVFTPQSMYNMFGNNLGYGSEDEDGAGGAGSAGRGDGIGENP
jgi:hypothetical protein